MTAKATDPVRHLQQLDELINRVVREAELVHDYIQLRFHGGLVLTLNNAVELDGQPLANSQAGRILLASVIGRSVSDVARAADRIVVNFRGRLDVDDESAAAGLAFTRSARVAAAESVNVPSLLSGFALQAESRLDVLVRAVHQLRRVAPHRRSMLEAVT